MTDKELLYKAAGKLADDLRGDADDGNLDKEFAVGVDPTNDKRIIIYYRWMKRGYRACKKVDGIAVTWKKFSGVVPA